MEKLIVASKNKGKIREVRQILGDRYEIVPMSDIGIDVDIEETGKTFLENALIKARYVYNATGLTVLSDDSGLEIDALGGAPGVYSARYAGEHGRDGENNALVLKNMQGVKNRSARFKCAVALVGSKGEYTAQGSVEGYILNEEVGENGFGYDPLFYCTEIDKPFGLALPEEKNSVSHRSRALRSLVNKLNKKNYVITVVSDSHGNVGALKELLPVINAGDYFVYLGDGNRDIDKIMPQITVETVRVKGNCDILGDVPDETVLQVGEVKFFITHGNAYAVKSSRLSLALRAKEQGCDFALYGHTHSATVTQLQDVTLVNPGTLSYGYGKSYALIKGDGASFGAEIVKM